MRRSASRSVVNGHAASEPTPLPPPPAPPAVALAPLVRPEARRGRPPLPPDERLYLTVDLRFPEAQAELLTKHATRTGVTAPDVIREILERHLAAVSGSPAPDSPDAIRIRLPERLYDPLCQHALRTGVTIRSLIRAIVLRHLASARW